DEAQGPFGEERRVAAQIRDRGEDRLGLACDKKEVGVAACELRDANASRRQIEPGSPAVEEYPEASSAPHERRTGIALRAGPGHLYAEAQELCGSLVERIGATDSIERRILGETEHDRAAGEAGEARYAQQRMLCAGGEDRECSGSLIERNAELSSTKLEVLTLPACCDGCAGGSRGLRRHHEGCVGGSTGLRCHHEGWWRCARRRNEVHVQHIAAEHAQRQCAAR